LLRDGSATSRARCKAKNKASNKGAATCRPARMRESGTFSNKAAALSGAGSRVNRQRRRPRNAPKDAWTVSDSRRRKAVLLSNGETNRIGIAARRRANHNGRNAKSLALNRGLNVRVRVHSSAPIAMLRAHSNGPSPVAAPMWHLSGNNKWSAAVRSRAAPGNRVTPLFRPKGAVAVAMQLLHSRMLPPGRAVAGRRAPRLLEGVRGMAEGSEVAARQPAAAAVTAGKHFQLEAAAGGTRVPPVLRRQTALPVQITYWRRGG
jgi:hypothetical protein